MGDYDIPGIKHKKKIIWMISIFYMQRFLFTKVNFLNNSPNLTFCPIFDSLSKNIYIYLLNHKKTFELLKQY